MSSIIEPMRITSGAFKDGESIPAAYTCDEEKDLSPALGFSDVPEGAKSLVLLMDDPDVPQEVLPSGVFDHWVLFNVEPATAEIPEGGTAGTAGRNSAGENRYMGPCPPPQYEPPEHRYVFALYALDVRLPLEEGASKAEVLEAMAGHILAEARLTGTYRKR